MGRTSFWSVWMEAAGDGADPREVYSVEMRVGSIPRNLADEFAPLRSDAASLSRHCPISLPSLLCPLAQRRPRPAAARAHAVAAVHGPRHAVPRSPAVDWPRHAALAPAGEAEPLRRRGWRAMSAAAGEGRGRAPSTTRAKAGSGGSDPAPPCSLHTKARGNAEKAASGGSGPAPVPLLHAEARGRAGGGRRRLQAMPRMGPAGRARGGRRQLRFAEKKKEKGERKK